MHLQPGVAFSSIVGWQIESSNGAFDFFFCSQKFVLICESLLNSKKNKQTKKTNCNVNKGLGIRIQGPKHMTGGRVTSEI